jgi:hypothetical protein
MDRQTNTPITEPTEGATRVPTCAEALRGLAVLLARAEARRLAATVPANTACPPNKKDTTR